MRNFDHLKTTVRMNDPKSHQGSEDQRLQSWPPAKEAASAADDGTKASCADVDPVVLLHQANLAFNASLEMTHLLPAILDWALKAAPVPAASLWLLDTDSQEMVCHQAVGDRSEESCGRRLRLDTGLFASISKTRQTHYVAHAPDEFRPPTPADPQSPSPAPSLLCVPLGPSSPCPAQHHVLAITPNTGTDTPIIGALVLLGTEGQTFGMDQRFLLESLATAGAIAIGHARFCSQARREIKDRVNTEQALRESESHYRALIETSPDAILVATLSGIITLCNGRALDLYRCTSKLALIGKHLLSIVAPETRVQAAQHLERVSQGEASKGIELTHMRSDGTTFEAELVASLIADSAGEADGIVAFVKDITVQKDAKRAIERHNLELRILNTVASQIAQTHDLQQMVTTALDRSLEILEVDTGWSVIYARDPSRTGLRCDLIVERGSAAEPGLADPRPETRQWLEEQVRRAQKPVLGSIEQATAVGLQLAVRCPIAGVPLLVGGSVAGVLAVVGLDHGHPRPLRVQQIQLLSAISHHVSSAIENAQLSAQAAELDMLRALDRMRSDLLAGFSHDLRSPLGLITMTCATLLRKDLHLDETTQDEMLTDIKVQSDRLLRLVEGILDLGRLQDHHLMLRRDMLDLGELARRLVRNVARTIDRHSIEFELPDIPLWVFADADRIEQVIYNLLDNAIKYSPDGGPVYLYAQKQQNRIQLSVVDQGIGIPEDQLDTIFERFYRVRSEATSHITGVGLGLATCKGIIEAHQGHIWAESQVGKGTTLHFTLPAAPELTLIAGMDL